MQGTITVYFNTGFNGVDIPASPAVLASASQKSYNDIYYVREDIDKPSIRIKDSYENLCAVDYCALTTSRGTSYYFAVPTALARGVTLLSLDLDALLTMGGASNLDYISGWQERGHIAKSDDVLFGNIASEDWRPSEPLVARNSTKLVPVSTVTQDYDIIISNIDIGGLGADQGADQQTVIEGIVNGETDPAMYFPRVKVPTGSMKTSFTIYDYDEGQTHGFSIPSTVAYDASNTTVIEGLQKLYSCGQLQLQASYKIPKEYLANTPTVSTATGYISNITGIHGTTALNDLPFEYTEGSYTPKNKKVFATYRTYNLVNIGSGDCVTKSPEELSDGSAQPSVNIWADPTSTGKPYARFSYIKGSPLQWFDCVKGLQWANSQLVMEGASGSMWNAIDTAMANRSAESQKAYSAFARQIGMKKTELTAQQKAFNNPGLMMGNSGNASLLVGGLMTGVLGGNGLEGITGGLKSNMNATFDLQQLQQSEHLAAGSYALEQRQLDQQINQNNIGLIQSNQVVAPSVSFTPEQNLGLYGYNHFVAYEVRKSLNDLKSEDMYYQRYGYNGLHRPLTQQCFNERQYYCYVQAFDVNLKGAQEFGLRVRSKAISQLNSGVRVWKVLPDASYYETN